MPARPTARPGSATSSKAAPTSAARWPSGCWPRARRKSSPERLPASTARMIVRIRRAPRIELAAAGIPFEVVPGVTAGVAAPAYAGIPVTHRDEASAVAFVTGHEDPSKPESALDWDALARFPGTLVFYMGVKQLGEIAQRLA